MIIGFYAIAIYFFLRLERGGMSGRGLGPLLLPLAAALVVAASAARAMVPGDLLDLRTAHVQDLSPDGRWLLYTLSAWDDGAARSRTTLYRRNLDTGKDLLIFTPEDQAHGRGVAPRRRGGGLPAGHGRGSRAVADGARRQ